VSRRGRAAAAALLGALLLLALGSAETARPRWLAAHPDLPVMLSVRGVPSDAGTLLPRLARVLHAGLGLPLPARITAHVYDGRAHFAQGLVTHAAVSVAQAAELAGFATGASIPGTILLVAPAPATGPGAEWPRLIAHELIHLAQIELAGRGGQPAQWLTEGMAEWAAYRALERLDLDDFESRRARARTAALQYVDRAGGLDLDALATPRGFIAQHRRIGTLLTYRLALHLTDELVARHGFTALVGYFGAFRTSSDEPVNFHATFGVSSRAFARRTLDRLRRDPPAPSRPTTSATTVSGAAVVSTRITSPSAAGVS
jgi:hypothetical protein